VRDKVRVGCWVAMKLDVAESSAETVSREKLRHTERLGLEPGLEAFYRYTKFRYY
jgi:hypothetical protein